MSTQGRNVRRNFDTMNLIERRLSILVGARFVDTEKISKSVEKMKQLRKRLSPKAKGFNACEIIRKWREGRWKF